MSRDVRWLRGWREAFGVILQSDSVAPSVRLQWTVLALILLVTIAVRLGAIGVPALDRTYWKEIDYLAISTNYWKHGYHFLRPEIEWPAEGPRVTAMEFPLVPYLAGLAYPVLGFNPFSVRLPTLVAFLLLSVYVFLLVRRELGPTIGLLAAAAASVLPLHNPFGRILYSEPLMLAMSGLGLYHFAEWVQGGRRRDWLLAVLGFSLAVALKAEPLYLLLPLGWIAFRTYGWRLGRYGGAALFVGVSLILPVAWYAYAYHLTRTSIDVFGVFGGHDKFQTVAMLSRPDWYGTIARRVGYGVLGGAIGTALALAGIVAAALLRRGGLFVAYLVAIACYFAIVAEGNWDAVYRQLHILPAISVFVALGAAAAAIAFLQLGRDAWRRLSAGQLRMACLAVAAALVILVPLRRHAEVLTRDAATPADPAKWDLAQEARKHRTSGAKLIAAGEYTIHRGGNDLSPMLYHYAGMQGWTLQSREWTLARVDELIRKGATLFAASNMSREPTSAPFLREMRARFPVLWDDSTRGLLLLDLQRPKAGIF